MIFFKGKFRKTLSVFLLLGFFVVAGTLLNVNIACG